MLCWLCRPKQHILSTSGERSYVQTAGITRKKFGLQRGFNVGYLMLQSPRSGQGGGGGQCRLPAGPAREPPNRPFTRVSRTFSRPLSLTWVFPSHRDTPQRAWKGYSRLQTGSNPLTPLPSPVPSAIVSGPSLIWFPPTAHRVVLGQQARCSPRVHTALAEGHTGTHPMWPYGRVRRATWSTAAPPCSVHTHRHTPVQLIFAAACPCLALRSVSYFHFSRDVRHLHRPSWHCRWILTHGMRSVPSGQQHEGWTPVNL